jgi:hypothetical protein
MGISLKLSGIVDTTKSEHSGGVNTEKRPMGQFYTLLQSWMFFYTSNQAKSKQQVTILPKAPG